MSSQRVYLIRHGEVEGNILQLDRLVTVEEFNAFLEKVPSEPINATGVAQIEAIVPAIASYNLTRLYTSPLPRALQTAAILGERTGLSVITHPELYELLPPPVLGPPERKLTLKGAYVRSGLRLASPFARDHETFVSAFVRVRRVWRELLRANRADFGIVGHQGIFRMLFVWVHMTPRWRLVQGDTHNGGISIVARRF